MSAVELHVTDPSAIDTVIAKANQSLSLFNHEQDWKFIKSSDLKHIHVLVKPKDTLEWLFFKTKEFKLSYEIDTYTGKAKYIIRGDSLKAHRAKIYKLYSQRYMITDRGLVIDLERLQVCSMHLDKGYFHTNIKIEDIPKVAKVHRMVAHAFCPKPEKHQDKDYEDLVVNHIDGVKDNNHYTNLEWCTQQENTQHAMDTGLSPKGQDSPFAKLTQDQVDWVRQHKKENPSTLLSFYAKTFCVSHNTICNIIYNKKWKNGDYEAPEISRTVLLEKEVVDAIRSEYRADPRLTFAYFSRKYNILEATASRIIYNEYYTDSNYTPPFRKVNKIMDMTKATEMRAKYATGNYTFQRLADEYSWNETSVRGVIYNLQWKDPNYSPPSKVKAQNNITMEQASWIRRHRQEHPQTLNKFYAEKFGTNDSSISMVISNKLYYDPNYTPPALKLPNKVSDETVRKIREHKKANPETMVSYYASLYNIKYQTCVDICNGKSFKHIVV